MAWAGSGIFTQTIIDILDNTTAIDLNGDTFYVALYGNAVTPDYDATAANTAYGAGTWIAGNEVDHGGAPWPAGGVALSTPTLTPADPNPGQISWDAVDVSVNNTTISGIYGCMIYSQSIATPVADQGICAVQFSGAPYSTSNGTFAITWDPNGIWYLDLVP